MVKRNHLPGIPEGIIHLNDHIYHTDTGCICQTNSKKSVDYPKNNRFNIFHGEQKHGYYRDQVSTEQHPSDGAFRA